MGTVSSGTLRLSMVTDANAGDGVPVFDPPFADRGMLIDRRRWRRIRRSVSIIDMNVRRATEADVDPMAAQLCRSFFDDPVMEHVFRNEARRNEGMRRYFTTQMRRDYLPFGGCFTTDDHQGAAIWGPPGKPLLTGLAGLRNLVSVLPYVAAHLSATLRLLSLLEMLHPHESHWYLATLGTDPVAQGKGIGSALMGPALEHCDAEGWPAYLESSKERNVPFYARHGFQVVREVPLPGGGPKIWTMWREPRPPNF